MKIHALFDKVAIISKWVMQGLNLRPLSCEDNALPLS